MQIGHSGVQLLAVTCGEHQRVVGRRKAPAGSWQLGGVHCIPLIALAYGKLSAIFITDP